MWVTASNSRKTPARALTTVPVRARVAVRGRVMVVMRRTIHPTREFVKTKKLVGGGSADCWMLVFVARGAWRVARGAWRVARGAWRVARGAWRVARGAWRVAMRPMSGRWRWTGGRRESQLEAAGGDRGPLSEVAVGCGRRWPRAALGVDGRQESQLSEVARAMAGVGSRSWRPGKSGSE